MKRILAGWMDWSQEMIAKDEGYRRFIQKYMFDITVVVLTGMKRQTLYECRVVIYLPVQDFRFCLQSTFLAVH